MPPPPMLVALAFCGTSSLAGWILFGRIRRPRRLRDEAPAGSDDEAGQADRLIEHDSGEDNDAPAGRDEAAGQDGRIEHGSGGPGSPEGARVSPALDAIHSWLSEVMLLRGLCHKNIMNLVPAASRNSSNAAADELVGLAYDHAENGSLDKWLHPTRDQGEQRRPLSWPTRRAVAIGVAGGLCYLHRRSIIHHNINSSNVMLDRAFNPKIAGFGLAQKTSIAGPPDGDDQQPTFQQLPTGNFGYTAPDYVTMIGELTEKVDVYSFGVVLLELVTGRVANEPAAVIEDDRRGAFIVNHHQPRRHRRQWRLAHHHLPTWARDVADNRGGFNSSVVDQRIPDKARYMREMAATFKLGVDCTIPNAHRRPSMARVLTRLRYHGCLLSWIKSRRIMRCLP